MNAGRVASEQTERLRTWLVVALVALLVSSLIVLLPFPGAASHRHVGMRCVVFAIAGACGVGIRAARKPLGAWICAALGFAIATAFLAQEIVLVRELRTMSRLREIATEQCRRPGRVDERAVIERAGLEYTETNPIWFRCGRDGAPARAYRTLDFDTAFFIDERGVFRTGSVDAM